MLTTIHSIYVHSPNCLLGKMNTVENVDMFSRKIFSWSHKDLSCDVRTLQGRRKEDHILRGKKKREIVGEQEDGLTRGHPVSPACVRQCQLLPSEPLALR